MPCLPPATLPRALTLPTDRAGEGGRGSQPPEAHGELLPSLPPVLPPALLPAPLPALLPAAPQPAGVPGLPAAGVQAAEPQGYEAQMQAVRDVLLMAQAGQAGQVWP